MGNPIQYRNTDNKGGFRKTASVRPPGAYPEGVNENVSPVLALLPISGVSKNLYRDCIGSKTDHYVKDRTSERMNDHKQFPQRAFEHMKTE